MYKLLSWITVIIWMYLIFYLSHQPAIESSELSSSVTEVIISSIGTVAPKVKIEKSDLHQTVRKNAHFSYYLIFGILAVNALRMNGARGYRSILLALLIYIISFCNVHQLCCF
jgi:VanZ family protein